MKITATHAFCLMRSGYFHEKKNEKKTITCCHYACFQFKHWTKLYREALTMKKLDEVVPNFKIN